MSILNIYKNQLTIKSINKNISKIIEYKKKVLKNLHI